MKLPSVASETYFDIVSAAPKIVSSDFGKDEVTRQVTFGAALRERRRSQRRGGGSTHAPDGGLGQE